MEPREELRQATTFQICIQSTKPAVERFNMVAGLWVAVHPLLLRAKGTEHGGIFRTFSDWGIWPAGELSLNISGPTADLFIFSFVISEHLCKDSEFLLDSFLHCNETSSRLRVSTFLWNFKHACFSCSVERSWRTSYNEIWCNVFDIFRKWKRMLLSWTCRFLMWKLVHFFSAPKA